jgi:hypothetical protein
LEAKKYKTQLALRVDSNRRTKTIQLVGYGVDTPVRFDPPELALGPILPYSESVPKLVTIHNDSDIPIEIYSLDFDTIYREEEAILSAINVYDENSKFATLPRLNALFNGIGSSDD